MSVILGRDTATKEPVELDDDARTRGLYIIGKNGTGKSTLILNMLVADIEAGKGVCLLDPHGDLTDDVLVRIPINRRNDVLYLDAGNGAQPFGLNLFSSTGLIDEPLRSRRVNQIVMAFRKAFARYDFGITVATMLRNIAYVFIRHEGMKISDIPTFLTDRAFRARLLGPIGNTLIRSYWHDYDLLADRDRVEMIRPLMSRLSEILTDDLLLGILDQEETSVDFRQAMDGQKIVLVRLPVSKLDEDPVSLLGTMIVGQLLTAALSRGDLPRDDRKTFCIYADEFHRFATEDFGTFFNEARKYGIALTIAHQERGQIEDIKIATVVMGAESLVVFNVSGDDAIELAKTFDHTPPPPEVNGSKPLYLKHPRPADYLIAHTHPVGSKSEREFIETFHDWVVSSTKPQYIRRYHDKPSWYELAWTALNNILFVWMEETQPREIPNKLVEEHSKSILHLLAGVALVAGHSFHKYEWVGPIQEDPSRWDYPEKLASPGTFVAQAVHDETSGGAIRDLLIAGVPCSHNVRMSAARKELAQGLHGDLFTPRPRNPIPAYSEWPRVHEFPFPAPTPERVAKYPDGAKDAVRFVDWIYELASGCFFLLGLGLHHRPIMVPSGVLEPTYAPVRSYADMENEITTRLANMPRYTAKVRTVAGEFTIRTELPRPETGPFIPSIQWKMRHRVMDIPVQDVLSEIDKRTKQDTHAENPPYTTTESPVTQANRATGLVKRTPRRKD